MENSQGINEGVAFKLGKKKDKTFLKVLESGKKRGTGHVFSYNRFSSSSSCSLKDSRFDKSGFFLTLSCLSALHNKQLQLRLYFCKASWLIGQLAAGTGFL